MKSILKGPESDPREGDNPGVSEGCPITIGWKHDDVQVVNIEQHEFLRKSRPRRRRKDLVMKSGERDAYLLSIGYKLEELINAAEETKKIRKLRQQSMKGTNWDRFKGLFGKNDTGFGKTKPQQNIVLAKTA